MAIEITNDTILRILVRRGAEAEKNTVILAQGEPGYALDTQTLCIGDGITLGGNVIPNVDNISIGWAGTAPDYIEVKDGGIINSKLAPVSGNTVKGNDTSSLGSPTDIPISSNSVLGRISNINGGNLTSLTLAQLFGTVFSALTPNPSVTTIWFNTTNGVVYNYNGANWLGLHRLAPSGPDRILYVGTGASVNTYDGGDTNTPSISSGPMWEVDTNYTSKVLRGAALGASATLPLPAGGADGVVLTTNMLPPHTHNVKILIPGHGGNDGTRDAADGGRYSSPNSSDPSFNWNDATGGAYPGTYSKDVVGLPFVYQDYGNGQTSPSVTPAPLQTLPAYQEVLVLKRTARVYYTS